VIPLKKIFEISKIRGPGHRLQYIRTFVLLDLLYPNSGLNVLIHSIKQEFPDEYYGDEFIATVITFGQRVIKDSFHSYQVMLLLNSIQTKLGAVVDSASEFESSAVLVQRTEPDK
jgi:hypothetical protein